MTATNRNITYPRCKAKNRGRSVDAHAKHRAVTRMLSLLPIKAANMSVMHITTKSLVNYRTFKTTNRWRSVDAHFQDAARSLILLFLIWKAANTKFMDGGNQSALRWPKMHSQKLLTLCWSSFSEWCSDHVVYSFTKKGRQYARYG